MANSSESQQTIRRLPVLGKLWQRLEAMPKPEPENSIPLRIAVQALVIVGIIGMDVAAADIADMASASYWAIPLTIVGGIWSWYRRRDRNVPIKFAIAIGMLLSLGGFFGRLVSESYDTRLVLASLLIHLQVLHSFDLPRRKDLGYSIAIAMILLAVAGTVSQTLTFAPILVAFLAVALPVLVLDYRARLGLADISPRKGKKRKAWIGPELSPKRFGLFFIGVTCLGLLIFACLPRLPGYQLQNFPLSAPIEFQGRFDSSQINNPGYGMGEDGEGSGTGEGSSEGPGDVDETFYYGFNTTINQNLRGEMTPQVVMRVRSQAEGFWRVLAFDRYTGQGWEVSRNDSALTLNRLAWSYQFLLPRTEMASKTQDIVQTYTVVSRMPNLIPAMAQPKRLYFPLKQVAIDAEGGLRSPVALLEGLTYTVISEVPYRDRTALRNTSTTYPAPIRNYYLQLPEEIATKVRQETEAILAKSENPIVAPSEKALYLAQYLKQHYTIQPELPFFDNEEDLVDAFLFRYQGGYPDHFSTALTVMLRSIGIPARLVAGFAPGEFNPFTGLYIVRNTDAYTMTEVYFPEEGWFAFDPIPGHEVIPPSIEENQTFTVLRKFWQWVAGWLPSPVTGFLGKIGEAIMRTVAWVIRLFTQGWGGILSGSLLLTGIGFLGWLTWSGWRRWRYQRWLNRLPPMESLYQQMLAGLAQQGYRKHPAQTPLEYAEQLQQHQPRDRAQVVDEISRAYVGWRYGGETANYQHLRQLLQQLRQQWQQQTLKRRPKRQT